MTKFPTGADIIGQNRGPNEDEHREEELPRGGPTDSPELDEKECEHEEGAQDDGEGDATILPQPA